MTYPLGWGFNGSADLNCFVVGYKYWWLTGFALVFKWLSPLLTKIAEMRWVYARVVGGGLESNGRHEWGERSIL